VAAAAVLNIITASTTDVFQNYKQFSCKIIEFLALQGFEICNRQFF